MNLIDKQNGAGFLAQLGQHALQAFLKITAILGPRHQRTEIQRVYGTVQQDFRDIAVNDQLGQPFSHGGFSDTGFAHVQGIVFTPPTQNLNSAFHFILAANQGVYLALHGHLVQVAGEIFQRIFLYRFSADCSRFGLTIRFGSRMLANRFGNTVGNVVHHVQAGDVLLVQEIGSL